MERDYGMMIKRLWKTFTPYEKDYLIHAANRFGEHIKNGGSPTDDTSQRNFSVFMIIYRHCCINNGGYKPNLYGVDNKGFMDASDDELWKEAQEVLRERNNGTN